MKKWGTNDYGTISIGATESCGGSILPHLIEGFHETAPHIRFQIWTGNSDETQERLEKNLVDVAVVREPFNMEQYDRIFLNHEPWVIICNKEHFLAKRPEGVRVSELQDASLIIPIRQPIQNEINSWFNEIASERNIFCLYNSITSVMGFAEHNLGVIICPESAKNLINRETLTYRKIIDPVHESGTYLVKKHLQLMATATEKFWKYVEHQTKSNPSKYKESMR